MVTNIGVVGLGSMGGALAARLAQSGFTVMGYDLSKDAVDRATSRGVLPAHLEEMVTSCETVITSLPMDGDVMAVVDKDGFFSKLSGHMLIETSTILPTTMEQVAQRGQEYNVRIVDCALSGGPGNALDGSLSLLVACSDEALQAATPIIEHFGVIHHVADVPGKGKAVKLINNVMSMSNMAVASEVFVLGVKAGIEPQKLFDVLSQSGGRSNHFLKMMPRALRGEFAPGFRIELVEKDLRLAMDFARGENYATPITGLVHQMFQLAIENGLGKEDESAVAKLYEKWSGVSVRTK